MSHEIIYNNMINLILLEYYTIIMRVLMIYSYHNKCLTLNLIIFLVNKFYEMIM